MLIFQGPFPETFSGAALKDSQCRRVFLVSIAISFVLSIKDDFILLCDSRVPIYPLVQSLLRLAGYKQPRFGLLLKPMRFQFHFADDLRTVRTLWGKLASLIGHAHVARSLGWLVLTCSTRDMLLCFRLADLFWVSDTPRDHIADFSCE